MHVVEATSSAIATNKARLSMQDWLLHPQVQLAAYLPFFKEAGVHELQVSQPNCSTFGITPPLPFAHQSHQHLVCLQDVAQLQFDQIQPYMLPWHARHLRACMSDLLSKDVSNTLEPSLFCRPGSNNMLIWCAGVTAAHILHHHCCSCLCFVFLSFILLSAFTLAFRYSQAKHYSGNISKQQKFWSTLIGMLCVCVCSASCLYYTTHKSLELHRHLCNVADAKWLASSFFKHYSGALAHPDIALTNPADAVFLTQAALDKLDWTQQPFPGGAWKQYVQAALKQISMEDYYKMSNQRFPQALSSVGIYAAGMQKSIGALGMLVSAHCQIPKRDAMLQCGCYEPVFA